MDPSTRRLRSTRCQPCNSCGRNAIPPASSSPSREGLMPSERFVAPGPSGSTRLTMSTLIQTRCATSGRSFTMRATAPSAARSAPRAGDITTCAVSSPSLTETNTTRGAASAFSAAGREVTAFTSCSRSPTYRASRAASSGASGAVVATSASATGFSCADATAPDRRISAPMTTRTLRGRTLPTLHELIKPAGVALEIALVGQFLPDLAPEAGGGLDRHDLRRLAPRQRAAAELGVVVEPRKFQPLLERFQRFLEFFVGGRHRPYGTAARKKDGWHGAIHLRPIFE